LFSDKSHIVGKRENGGMKKWGKAFRRSGKAKYLAFLVY
jgi:hypothetical protein